MATYFDGMTISYDRSVRCAVLLTDLGIAESYHIKVNYSLTPEAISSVRYRIISVCDTDGFIWVITISSI